MRSFAQMTDKGLRDFYPARMLVEMCQGKIRHEIVEVELTEDPNGELWAWEDAATPGKFNMIFPSFAQLSICFPYGLELAEGKGRGRRVRLTATRI